MARSNFYYHAKRYKSGDKYEEVRKAISGFYHKHKGRMGYRRITLLLKGQGYTINHKTVYRLMQLMKLKSLIRGKKYRSYRGEEGKIAPNVLNRMFKSAKPNQKWVTDITEFNIGGKKLYLSPIMDLYNQEIVSYELSEHPSLKSVTKMLEQAFEKQSQLESLILHSDQGWQYQMRKYQKALEDKGIVQSMSRKGNCLDNAVMENFFGTLKTELFYLKKYKSIEELKKEIKGYITYYNHDRIKLNLNGMSPVQYRAHHIKN